MLESEMEKIRPLPQKLSPGEDRHENKYKQLLQWMLGQRSVQALQGTMEGAVGGSRKSFVEES